jgi:nitroreductase
MEVLEAMRARVSTRAFLDRPVDRTTVEAILEAARWAPSGTNTQPWQVAVVTGTTKRRITEALVAARTAGEPERPDYRYYPEKWEEPYRSRRLACGLALYRALGIGREDADRRIKAWNNNYSFFGAPVGLFFFLDRTLAQGSWVDMGMFLQNVMLAARAFDLATCPQAALAEYPDIVRRLLNVPDTRALVCGMSLGYPDTAAPVNNFRTARESVANFTRWYE